MPVFTVGERFVERASNLYMLSWVTAVPIPDAAFFFFAFLLCCQI